jgi:hypothetical protein
MQELRVTSRESQKKYFKGGVHGYERASTRSWSDRVMGITHACQFFSNVGQINPFTLQNGEAPAKPEVTGFVNPQQ